MAGLAAGRRGSIQPFAPRYRSTVAIASCAGRSVVSIVNSASDIGWMAIGFLVASRLPARASVALAIALELLTLWTIRDNLTLNVIMLFWPIEAIRQWQGM